MLASGDYPIASESLLPLLVSQAAPLLYLLTTMPSFVSSWDQTITAPKFPDLRPHPLLLIFSSSSSSDPRIDFKDTYQLHQPLDGMGTRAQRMRATSIPPRAVAFCQKPEMSTRKTRKFSISKA
jgi:hypothetical protein